MNDTDAWADRVRRYDTVSHTYRADDDTPADDATWLEHLDVLLAPSSAVVDLGCGCGVPIARDLDAAGHHVTGGDISAVQIERARRLVPNARFVCDELAAVSFDDSTFHAAVFLYSIIRLPIAQQPVVLSHVARWLRPDGVLVLTAGVDAWIGSEDRWLGTTAPMWRSQIETAAYRRWLNDAGFPIVDEQVVPYSWPTGGVEAMCLAIRELFTDATVWVQAGLPTTTGADEAIAIVRSWGVVFPAYDSEIRHVASSGDVVLVERVDIMRRAGGSVALALPVMSIAEFDNGKIMRWNEYYDTAVVPGLGASR